jgi:Kef-type K+ transport system membrane component KefB
LVFALILLIILLAPILLQKLKIPGIIGLIISGVIIGPFGLNILEKNSAVDLFSTIGLLYIMFIAGLELDMNEFKSNRNKSILFGFFTFILPLSIGYPVCRYLLGFDFNASLLIASMFATHTLVAYPIVSRLGVSKNEAVAITVGGTILTDTAVLMILAIIMGNSQGNLDQQFWIQLGISIVVFSVIMFFLVPRVARWFFQKREHEKHAHYIFVLFIVFFAAFLAEFSGLEPIIGAFVAGLALNQSIPHSSALMNRIEFIGNSLFIPFFLISVGMLVDVTVIFSGPRAIIIAVALTISAIIGKWVAAFFIQLSFKYSTAQRQLIFGLSSSHAAATLAVILVGFNAGILDANVLNGTIILILITCIVASIATENAAKKILITDKSTVLSNSEKNMIYSEHILLPIANLLNIEKLLEFTLLIKDKKSSNPITVLSVVPNNAESEINIVSAKKKLEKYKKQGAASEIKINTIATIDLNATTGIERVSKEILADIIILGWPNKAGILEKLIGEKIYSIINNVDKNLFICHQEKPLITQKRIIVLAPPSAEREFGFGIWLQKILKLSKELSIPVIFYGLEETYDAIKLKMEHNKWKGAVNFHAFKEWDDLLVLTDFVNADDLLILISARKNSVSYQKYLDHIPSKLEKLFHGNNKIVVYPQQNSQVIERNGENSSLSINKKTMHIESINKSFSKIFFKRKNN